MDTESTTLATLTQPGLNIVHTPRPELGAWWGGGTEAFSPFSPLGPEVCHGVVSAPGLCHLS